MPDRTFLFFSDEGMFIPNEGIFVGAGYIKLRETNSLGYFDPLGTFKENYIDLPIWTPSGDVFESFFGFNISYVDNGGLVKFQISPDGGLSYLWHNGLMWTPVLTSTDYNDWLEVDEHLKSFPVPWSSLRIRMHLIPSPKNFSPIVDEVSIIYRCKPHEILEDIFRSIVEFLKKNKNFVFPFEVDLLEPVSSYKVTKEDIGEDGDVESELKILTPIWVYEISSDPHQRNNLFDSFNEIDNIVLFKRELVGRIRMIFTCIPTITIQTDFDYEKMPSHPQITIEIVSTSRSTWDGPGDPTCHEKSIGNMKAMIHPGKRSYKASVRFRSYASKPQDSLMITGGVRRLIEQNDRIKSVAYDEYMQALWGPQNDSNWVIENMFAQQLISTFIWKDWGSVDTTKEVPLVDTPENGGGVIVHMVPIKR